MPTPYAQVYPVLHSAFGAHNTGRYCPAPTGATLFTRSQAVAVLVAALGITPRQARAAFLNTYQRRMFGSKRPNAKLFWLRTKPTPYW